ncbi:YaaR family protein [Candidatus Haliotispira prima]|uniref:YaaR family protein n=1 Tax=Candidatus Haliotispira prima TaxID=3034016 RepID=A0ABY8MG96_9SPIO|nr:YaaR family protein [Candidatus Haliotispira prima]
MAARLHSLDQNLSSAGLLQTQDRRRKGKTEKVSSSQFSRLLKKEELAAGSGIETRQEILQDYVEKISEAGRELQKAPTRMALKEYRRLVQGFLEQSLQNLYQIDEDLGRLNLSTGQRKKYSLIRVIDQELEELVKAVLSEQHANLDILQRIEQINGLLINLLS